MWFIFLQENVKQKIFAIRTTFLSMAAEQTKRSSFFTQELKSFRLKNVSIERCAKTICATQGYQKGGSQAYQPLAIL